MQDAQCALQAHILWVICTRMPPLAGPGNIWNSVAIGLLPNSTSVYNTARFLTYLNSAAYDAAIVTWKLKYTRLFWRPITAIRQVCPCECDCIALYRTLSPLPCPGEVGGVFSASVPLRVNWQWMLLSPRLLPRLGSFVPPFVSMCIHVMSSMLTILWCLLGRCGPVVPCQSSLVDLYLCSSFNASLPLTHRPPLPPSLVLASCRALPRLPPIPTGFPTCQPRHTLSTQVDTPPLQVR